MLSVPAGVRIWLVAGLTDMRRGIDGLSALVQMQLSADVPRDSFFIFRGRRGDSGEDPLGRCGRTMSPLQAVKPGEVHLDARR